MKYQDETREEYENIATSCRGTVAHQSAALSMNEHEPLLVALDSLLRYAKAYRKRFLQPLAEDGVLGDPWLDAAKGIRALLNGDGAVAMERGISTDSKDNGMLEGLFWRAIETAGFTEGDI
jgi:hypothetical protein